MTGSALPSEKRAFFYDPGCVAGREKGIFYDCFFCDALSGEKNTHQKEACYKAD